MKTYLILVGGLGNQMFMFASALALTKTWGSSLNIINYWFDGNQRGNRFLLYQRRYELQKFPLLKHKYPIPLYIIQFFVYNLTRFLNKILLNKNFFFFKDSGRKFKENLFFSKKFILMGYYQSYKYFQHLRPELINIFKLSEEDESILKRKINLINKDNKRLLMIHVRRDDTIVPGNEWTGILSNTYYERAMAILGAENMCILVFSDDYDWCKEQKIFENCNFIDEPDPVTTLKMMQYCDDFIIAGSTLSWWGAWLSDSNNKRVIAPNPFYESVDEQYDLDLIPKEWELLKSEFLVLNK
jgi:hypothetical protein